MHTHRHRFLPLGWAALSLSLSQPSSHEATQPPSHPAPPQLKPTPPLSASCLCVQHLCDTSITHGCIHMQPVKHHFTATGSGNVRALIFFDFKEAAPLHSSSRIITSYSSGLIWNLLPHLKDDSGKKIYSLSKSYNFQKDCNCAPFFRRSVMLRYA